MNEIFVKAEQPVKFSGEIIIGGDATIEMRDYDRTIQSFSYGNTADGRKFVILHRKKGCNHKVFFADTAVDLLAHKPINCIPQVIEQAKEDLLKDGGERFYTEITDIDYSRPFVAFIYGATAFAAQAECIERDGSYFLFKDKIKYFIYDCLKKMTVWTGASVSYTEIANLKLDQCPAIDFALAAAENLDDVPTDLLTKKGGVRKFPTAQLYPHVINTFRHTYGIFGLLVSDYSKESDNPHDYYYSKKSCLIQTKIYLSTGTKELITVNPKGSYFRYADFHHAFEFESPEQIAEVAKNLGLPCADRYIGIKVADIFYDNHKQAEIVKYKDLTVCILGKLIVSTSDYDIYELNASKGIEFALMRKQDSKYSSIELVDNFDELVSYVDNYTDLSIQELGRLYPQGFNAA